MAYLIPANMVYDALAAAYTWGDAEVGLDDVTDFPTAPGGVVYIDDGDEWILVKYGTVDAPNDELETLAAPLAVRASTGGIGHTFPIGTVVKLTHAADYLQPIASDIVNAPAGAIFYEDTDEIGSSASLTFDGTTFGCDKAAIFNNSEADVDFRVGALGITYAFVVDGATGRVGIGIAPAGCFHTAEGGAYNFTYHDTYSDGGHYALMVMRLSHHDTVGTLAATINNDILGRLEFHGVRAGAAAFGSGASISVVQQGVAGAIYIPARMHLETTDGANINTNQLVLNPTNNIGIRTLTFDGAAVGCLALAAGTAPAAHTDDQAYLWVEDVNAAAGYAGLHMMGENGAGSIKQIVVGAVIKGTTGQTVNPHEGLIEINTFDNSLKMYAEGAWRDIAAGW